MSATRGIPRICIEESSPHNTPHHRYEGSETLVSLNLRFKDLLRNCIESNREREEEDTPQAKAQRSRIRTLRVGDLVDAPTERIPIATQNLFE